MRYNEKLKKISKEKIWEEYCGYLDLSIDDYMAIQKRLLQEQLEIWSGSGIGRAILKGRRLCGGEDFRTILPLTDYYDYAELLGSRSEAVLPAPSAVWIQTTWEGGIRPIKLAPYTRAMLDTYRHNVITIMMLASSSEYGRFSFSPKDRVLYGGAPLPYATGLLPSLLDEELSLTWLPDNNVDSTLSFGERIREGFTLALRGGIDYFFALGSVAHYITESFSTGRRGGRPGQGISPVIAVKYLLAKYRCRRDERELKPGDIFTLKGFVSAGNDAASYRERLYDAWGVMPVEIAAGTESTCMACETWEHNGMVFFPDACFYEFIPEDELVRERDRRDYTVRTRLMDEVRAGETYELVISVLHGGAFMRYRIGDIYHCVSAGGGALPRFTYVDRSADVIDIAGFTRITENSIRRVFELSGISVNAWFARKEYDELRNPFLHMYLEIVPDMHAMGVGLLREQLTTYFKYFDSDYSDLKKLLGMDPLKITVIKSGTLAAFRQRAGYEIRHINPSDTDVSEVLVIHAERGSTRIQEAVK